METPSLIHLTPDTKKPKHKPRTKFGRLYQFFLDNPGEWLSSSDIIEKFGFANKHSVHGAITRLRKEFPIVADSIYRRG